jgi:hypothetical protein
MYRHGMALREVAGRVPRVRSVTLQFTPVRAKQGGG